jgi:hypothetical protein
MIRLFSPRLTTATLALAIGAAPGPLSAQTAAPVATEFNGLHFRSIGPTVMSGRIADIAVYEANPAIWYVGTAHGGVWKTSSNGALFTPMLQDQGLMSIGAMAVSQINPDIVWAATGRTTTSCSSRPPVPCTARAVSAACTRRPTADGRGGRCSASTT